MPSDPDSIRELFPQAVELEILIAGFIIILFDRVSNVKDAYWRIWLLELGSLRVFFDVSRYNCMTTLIESGIGLNADPNKDYFTRAGCLGPKLRLLDGSTAITTVTHGFVHTPKKSKSWVLFYTRYMNVSKQL
jgi:hypothetical protein